MVLLPTLTPVGTAFFAGSLARLAGLLPFLLPVLAFSNQQDVMRSLLNVEVMVLGADQLVALAPIME